MNNIELSIILVNFNTKYVTLECLESIKKYSDDISYEAILVDNGSNDGSIEEFQKIKNTKYWSNKLKLVFNKSNLGYAKANNQGIRLSKGNYTLLLNNDTLVHKNALRNLLEFAGENKDAGVVGSKLLNTNGTVQDSCFNFPSIGNAVKESWFNQKGLLDSYAPPKESPVTVDSLAGAAFLITPLARKMVGLLDERYFAYFEDMDYCRRVWKSGLKVYYLPSSVITHHPGGTFKKLTEYENQWRKLIPGSKIYNGIIKHYAIFFIMWSGQKWQKFFG